MIWSLGLQKIFQCWSYLSSFLGQSCTGKGTSYSSACLPIQWFHHTAGKYRIGQSGSSPLHAWLVTPSFLIGHLLVQWIQFDMSRVNKIRQQLVSRYWLYAQHRIQVQIKRSHRCYSLPIASAIFRIHFIAMWSVWMASMRHSKPRPNIKKVQTTSKNFRSFEL